MWLSRWVLAACILLVEASLISSSALLHVPSMMRRHDHNELMARSSRYYERESDLERRSPSPSPQSSSNNGSLSLASPDVEGNNATLQACTTGLQGIASVANEAGFAACYNILDWHENMGGMFQADLRLFQISQPAGQFANISMDTIGVQLNFPSSTQFSVLMNARLTRRSLQERQNGLVQIQQFSLVGSFKIQMDFNKLNVTETMSLLIPQIQLHANASDGTTVTSDIASSDTVYFVVGQFKDQATPAIAIQASNPLMAENAINDSKGFVLPGTTFGIFPVGLIVTGAWTLLFFVAFGLGTLGRIRHRDIYRKRVAATSGNSGKR
jgi:hypothetical protein